jgi:hypothetical protein
VWGGQIPLGLAVVQWSMSDFLIDFLFLFFFERQWLGDMVVLVWVIWCGFVWLMKHFVVD